MTVDRVIFNARVTETGTQSHRSPPARTLSGASKQPRLRIQRWQDNHMAAPPILRAIPEAGQQWDDPSEDLLVILFQDIEAGEGILIGRADHRPERQHLRPGPARDDARSSNIARATPISTVLSSRACAPPTSCSPDGHSSFQAGATRQPGHRSSGRPSYPHSSVATISAIRPVTATRPAG